MIIIPSVFVAVFIFMFMPFGFAFTPKRSLLLLSMFYGLLTGLVMFLNFFVIQKRVFKYFTIGRTILWNTWILISIGLVNEFAVIILFNGGRFSIMRFIYMQGYTLSLGTIISVFMILVHYNYQLKQKLKSFVEKPDITKCNKDDIIEFLAENKGKPFRIERSSICYLEGADNYVDIYYVQNNELKHILLRLTLKKAAIILEKYEEFKRCHKSFIVNLHHAKCVSSSQNGYKVSLSNFNIYIPVSRTLKSEIASFLNIN
jgi:hypothetical protein